MKPTNLNAYPIVMVQSYAVTPVKVFNTLQGIIFLLAVIFSTKAQAQDRAVVNQSIQWISLNSNIKLNPKFGLSVDAQLRFAQYESMQHMVRVGFDYYVSKKFSFIPVGYSYIGNFIYGDQPATYVNNEHRIFQQFLYKHKISRVAVSHRLRPEERFIQAHHKDSEGMVVNDGFTNKQFRVRYRLMANIPLNHPTMAPKTFYISVWDEIFASRGKAITYHEPDQNRIFVGPGYQITKDIQVQGGYIYQMLIKSNGTKQENNTGFLLQLNYNFDLTKKAEAAK